MEDWSGFSVVNIDNLTVEHKRNSNFRERIHYQMKGKLERRLRDSACESIV